MANIQKSVGLTAPDWKFLKRIAKAEKISVSEVVRRIVTAAIDGMKK